MEPVIGCCLHCGDYITRSMKPIITVHGLLHQGTCAENFNLQTWIEKQERIRIELKEFQEMSTHGPSGSKKEQRHRERQLFEKPRRKRK